MKFLALTLVAMEVFAQPKVAATIPNPRIIQYATDFARAEAVKEAKPPALSLPGDECAKKEADPFLVKMVDGLRKGFNGSTRGDLNWGLVKKIQKSDGTETFRQDLVAYKDSLGKIHYFDIIVGSCGSGVVPARDFIHEVNFDESENEFLWWSGAPLEPLSQGNRRGEKTRGPSSK